MKFLKEVVVSATYILYCLRNLLKQIGFNFQVYLSGVCFPFFIYCGFCSHETSQHSAKVANRTTSHNYDFLNRRLLFHIRFNCADIYNKVFNLCIILHLLNIMVFIIQNVIQTINKIIIISLRQGPMD